MIPDPQHGQSFKCAGCGGSGRVLARETGPVPFDLCGVPGCKKPAMKNRKICESHAFPAARPPGTTGRRAAIEATKRKIAEETKVSEGLADTSDKEI